MRVPRVARSLSVTASLIVMSAPLASAQTSPILPETHVIRGGPMSFYPTFAVRDAGTDSNVYNDQNGQKGDFTYSVVPRLFVVVPIANTRFVGTGFGNFVYFQTYKDQQSISGVFEGRYEVVSPGFRPFATAGFADRRERRGHEIDARVRQRQTFMSIGSDMDVTSNTALVGWVRREITTWDRDATYEGAWLSEQLDYTAHTFAGGMRVRVTPFTTAGFTVEVERDRFDRAPLRDANKLLVGPSLDFNEGGAIIGHVNAGYQQFKPLSPLVADYGGLAATSRLRFVFRDLLEVKFDADRDVDYSYDPLQPYYLESGGVVTLTQRVFGPVEVIAIGERRHLRHQRLGASSFDGRVETTRTVGGGFALQIQKRMRFELVYQRTTRTSSDPIGRDYERQRVFGSAIYGL